MSTPSKSQQTVLLKQFQNVTKATQTDALRLLKKHQWRLETAVDAFYTDATAIRNSTASGSGSSGGAGVKDDTEGRRTLEREWSNYADPTNPDQTNIDGVIEYCANLSVEPEDPVMISIAQLTKSPSMALFEKKGWIDGWSSVKMYSLEEQRAYLRTLRKGLEGEEGFKKVYEYAFGWARDPGQKSLQCETAIGLWKLLIPIYPVPNHFDQRRLDLWCTFLTEKGSKAISKSAWTLFLDFVKTTERDFGNHSLDDAWPSTIDDFVDWVKPKLANEMDTS